MSDPQSISLSPLKLAAKQLRNRLAVAPMTRVSASATGVPTTAMGSYYQRFAEGGFGLVITEGLFIDESFSQGNRFQPGIATGEQAEAWKLIVGRLHDSGALAFAQLMHAGALTQENQFEGYSVAPSVVEPKGKQLSFYYGTGRYPIPREISEEQIQAVIRSFAEAARRAVEIAGFDGIEIHGANGYLLDEFLTADLNLREDRWGGDIHARVSLLVEVVKAVKAEVGEEVLVGIRISQSKVNDYESKWPGAEEDAAVIFSSLQEAGADFIHVTERNALRPAFAEGGLPLFELAARHAPRTLVIVNGSLGEIETATTALEKGADIVSVGKTALANPDLPKLFADKRLPRPFDSSLLGPIANIKESELLPPT